MHFEGTPAIENLSACCAIVAEATKEMATLNVIPHIGPASMREHLADGAEVLVALGVPEEELVQVRGVLDRREVHTCAATTFMRPHHFKENSSFLYFKQDPAFLYWFICHFQ